MCHYHHLTLVEREKNMFFHAQDNSVSAIAKKLGRNKATISRELRRNTKNGFYQPATAQRMCQDVLGGEFLPMKSLPTRQGQCLSSSTAFGQVSSSHVGRFHAQNPCFSSMPDVPLHENLCQAWD